MRNLRPESHVVQQIRRDRLRVQNSSHQLDQFPNNLEQLSLQPGFNYDLLQVRNVRNANTLDDSAVYSSDMANFSTSLNDMSAPRNVLDYQELMMSQYGSFPNSSHCEELSNNLGNWRNSTSHQGSDWIGNYSRNPNPNSSLVSELNNVTSYLPHKQSSLSNTTGDMTTREISKQLGVMHHQSPMYQNALQDIAKSASNMASMMQQNDHTIWVGAGNQTELELNPNQLHCDSNPQSLSLSLSSNAQSKTSLSHFEEGSASDELQSVCGISSKDPQHLKYVNSAVKQSMVSKDCGKPLQDTAGVPSNSTSIRNVGPLGPFTGYATILKSSRFLKYAQQLLDEFCCLSGSKFVKGSDVSERVSAGEVGASTSAKGGYSGSSSSSMLYGAKENEDDRGAGSSFCLSPPPDYQQKKARLMYMQEEVTRRYKHYHQQMQMIVSSFESVAGLCSASPYISLALKSVTRHFRCLKNSISDQLKLISEVLGEDLSILAAGCSSKGDTNTGNTALLEPKQHVWRPQRGLPERSVAILKAWLFEHFLHPYPTDTDKHMLATQTGLSRNQVSNWFINARVRVWKPMVEEIHTLETKGTTSADQNSSPNERTRGTNGGSTQPGRVDKPLNKFGGYMEMGSSEVCNAEEEQWSQEKRSKLESQMASSMDGTLMGFVPYGRGGSVSLTLDLRHGVEGVQNQQQLQEEQLRRHFGGHMIYDFVG